MATTIVRRAAATLVVAGALVVVGYLFFGMDLLFQWALVAWSGFVLVVSLAAAVCAWKGRAGPVWVAAGALGVLSFLAVMSIGYVIAPQALLLAIVAAVISAQRWLSRSTRSR
jgi:hypothetical protein